MEEVDPNTHGKDRLPHMPCDTLHECFAIILMIQFHHSLVDSGHVWDTFFCFLDCIWVLAFVCSDHHHRIFVSTMCMKKWQCAVSIV